MLEFSSSVILPLVVHSVLTDPSHPNAHLSTTDPDPRPYSLIRTCVTLTLICLYIFWAIMYMAQLHPLISESSLLAHSVAGHHDR